MKKYFAKYLPVEGDSEFVQCWSKAVCKRSNTNSALYHLIDDNEGQPPITDVDIKKFPSGFKYVKLFLCSREIQVGDRCFCMSVHLNNGDHDSSMQINPWRIRNESDTCESCIKAIGEISPNVTWVKDGDEFDEEQICCFMVNGFNSGSQTHILPFVEKSQSKLYYGRNNNMS